MATYSFLGGKITAESFQQDFPQLASALGDWNGGHCTIASGPNHTEGSKEVCLSLGTNEDTKIVSPVATVKQVEVGTAEEANAVLNRLYSMP